MKYQAYIFDLDGTLLDTSPGVFHCMRHALLRSGKEVPDDTILAKTIGPALEDSFVHLFGFSEEGAADGVRLYREEYAAGGMYMARPYDGIVELQQTHSQNGCTLGVATLQSSLITHPVHEKFGFSEYFTAICGSVRPHDTKESVLKHCLEALSCEPQNAVLIGDSPYDALGAQKVGTAFIGAGFGFGFQNAEAPFPVDMAASPMDILSYC